MTKVKTTKESSLENGVFHNHFGSINMCTLKGLSVLVMSHDIFIIY